MKRKRYGKFKDLEIALDQEILHLIFKGYNKKKQIRFFTIKDIRL